MQHQLLPYGIVEIAEGLSNVTALCKLDHASIEAIGNMLKNNSVAVLGIDDCDIRSDGASVIGDAIKHNTSLKSLNLRGNSIEDLGASAVANGIRGSDSSSLNLLILKQNDIGIVGASAIATMLSTNESLIELDLCRNDMMGTEGVIAIVEALKHNNSLEKLTLDEISFGDDGARNIAALLTTNASLKELDMNECSIGDGGAVAIADVLKTNTTLEYISLDGNPISAGVIINKFAPMLEINTTLKVLSLCWVEVTTDDVLAAVLRTLEDYNDTVSVRLQEYFGVYNEAIHGVYNKIIDEIRDIGEDNCNGIRIAPIKAERIRRKSIFNYLQFTWIQSKT